MSQAHQSVNQFRYDPMQTHAEDALPVAMAAEWHQ